MRVHQYKKNRYVFSVKKWNEELEAIGLFTKSGRYGGGIYAHMETLSLASMDGLKWLPGSELE